MRGSSLRYSTRCRVLPSDLGLRYREGQYGWQPCTVAPMIGERGVGLDDSRIDVLVPHAEALGVIAVIRSLGRAGYRVHAVSERPTAIGLQSRYATVGTVSPGYSDPGYVSWLRDYVGRHGIAVIIPSEGFLVAVLDNFAEFAPLMPLPADLAVVRRCFSKVETIERMQASTDAALRSALPPSMIAREPSDLDDISGRLAARGPVFIKTDAVLARQGGPGLVRKAATPEEAARVAGEALRDYSAVLLQIGVPGHKATVNVCLREGRVLARSMALASHESPHQGGLTVLRHTWWHEGMYEDAIARLRCLEWDGVAMVEYKWNASARAFHFIEANTRYWAALHLDLFAGTDFPVIQVANFLGQKCGQALVQPVGVTSRHTVPGEIGYLMSRLRDPKVQVASKLWAICEFFLLFLNPRIHSDLLFPGDRHLYWRQWMQFLKDLPR
jgi:hypothetical protein